MFDEDRRNTYSPTAVAWNAQLTNWGLTTNTTESGLKAYTDVGPCFRPGQDIVIPAPFNSEHRGR
jgi:hypothetical protein